MSLFTTAISGLNAAKASLDVTSNNISNVDSPDYTRQSVELTFRGSQTSGIGTGVQIERVRRHANELITNELRQTTSIYNQLETYYKEAIQIDSLLSDESTGLSPALQDFFGAVQAAADDPAAVPARETLLSHADILVNRFHTIYNQLSSQNNFINVQSKTITSEINTITEGIASLNQKISTRGANPAYDLYDQRDKLLRQLAEKASITTSEQTDGSANVFLSNGQYLVLGQQVNRLTTVTGAADPTRRDLAITANGTTTRLDDTTISGGELGGLFQFRREVLDRAYNGLGRVALGLSKTFNDQHQKGADLNGTLGRTFFSDVNTAQYTQNRVIADSRNIGSGVVTTSVSDISALTTSNYQLLMRNGGSNYQLTRLSDNVQVASGSISSLPSLVTADGITLNLASGTFEESDSYIITPTRRAGLEINVDVTDTSAIALAAPVRSHSNSANIGSGEISAASISDATNTVFTTLAGNLSPELRIEFLSPTSYRILNDATGSVIEAGPFQYSPGLKNNLFPSNAVIQSSAGSLVTSGSLAALNSGDLILNGTTIAAGSSDGISTTDASASAIAIAAAINAVTTTHGVVATAQATTLDLGTFTAGTISGIDFQINGQNVVVASAAQSALIASINSLAGTTGVTAAADSSNNIILTANDGRNIQVTTAGSVATATFSNFDLTGPANDDVQRGAVLLSSSLGSIAITGFAPGDVGLSTTTVNQYDPGFTAVLTGSPSTGDTFTLAYNTDGVSDNRNGILLANIQSMKVLVGNTSSLQDDFSTTVGEIGTKTREADISREANEALMHQREDIRNGIAGVNLDEEASNLLQYQRSYQANAQVISVAATIFDILFAALAR